METGYFEKNLVEIDKEFSLPLKEVVLTGKNLTIVQIISVARQNARVSLTDDPSVISLMRESYAMMLEDIKKGVPVYGCNTAYGAQASRVLINGKEAERIKMAKKISEGISHVDVGVGPVFAKDIVRAAMLIRINMLMGGVSGVRPDDLEIYRQMLNKQITPVVNQYGGIGASGDLAHNARILDAARQLKGVKVWDKDELVKEAKIVLSKAGIKPLLLEPKAGLAFVNGDNFSTALALLLGVDTLRALLISVVLGAMTIEVLKGSSRSFHPLLSSMRPHSGQKETASLYAYLLEGSFLAYQEMSGHKPREKGVRVQDPYSLRGIAQYHGVNFEKIKLIFNTININANSVSDNPLWVPPDQVTEKEKPWQWVSGGNFLAMHMAEAMDGLRKIMTQIVKLNDRHLARMVNTHENNGLPPNLSSKDAVTQCVFKGLQIQSGMFDVYSSLLSIPVTTFFGIHEEGNQDITSHALTSGILGLENLRLVRYSLAQNLLALCQAVDLRGGSKKLSPRTRPLYEFVRSSVSYIKKEQPLNNEIETVYNMIIRGDLNKVIRESVLNDFAS